MLQDSPQRGANIPLGLSALIRQLQLSLGTYTTGDADVLLKEANALLDAPATRQLLLYQTVLTSHQLTGSLTYNTIDYSGNTFLDGIYRPKVSYAAPYRIVAVSQGSQCGVGLFQPYAELIRAQGLLPVFNLPFIFFGSGSLAGQVIVNAIPAGGASARVSGLRLLQQTQLFFGLITVQVNLVNDNFTCPAGLLPLDGAPGGTEPIGDLLGASNLLFGTLIGGHQLFVTAALVPTFAFLPTASGLDVEDFNATTLTGAYLNGITSASRSRTDGFLAQEQIGSRYNQPHLTYTARNGEWIYNEMQRPYNGNQNPLTCNATGCDPTAGKQIGGPVTLCVTGSSSPAIYTSPLQGAGYTYQWSVDDCSQVTVCSGAGPTFQTANAVSVGEVTLTLTVYTPCPFTFTKRLAVGAPDLGYQQDPLNSSPCHQILAFRLLYYDPALRYTTLGTMGMGAGGTFKVKGTAGASKSFSVSASNDCGTRTVGDTIEFSVCPGPTPTYQVYPNPANDQTTVVQADDSTGARPTAQRTAGNSTAIAATAFTVAVYDSYGQQRLSASANGPTASLNTSQLQTGLYLLVITEDGTGVIVHRQLEVAR